MEKEYYKINKDVLIHLLANNAKLKALENGGVDNWSVYDVALDNFWDEYCESYPAVKHYSECEGYWADFNAVGKYELHNYERI